MTAFKLIKSFGRILMLRLHYTSKKLDKIEEKDFRKTKKFSFLMRGCAYGAYSENSAR